MVCALRQQVADLSAAGAAAAAQTSAAELACIARAAAGQAAEAAQCNADSERQRAEGLATQLAEAQDAVKVKPRQHHWLGFGGCST